MGIPDECLLFLCLVTGDSNICMDTHVCVEQIDSVLNTLAYYY